MNPLRCLLCPQPAARELPFCASCLESVASSFRCRSEGSTWLSHGRLLPMGTYENAYAKLIRLAKRQPANELPREFRAFFEELVLHWRSEILDLKPQAVVSVPSYPLRVWMQTDLSAWLAHKTASLCGLAVRPHALRIGARTMIQGRSPQKRLSRAQRWLEIERPKFSRSNPRENYKGLRILLVDDVCATGASLESCQRLLEGAGARIVGSLVLAQSPLRH